MDADGDFVQLYLLCDDGSIRGIWWSVDKLLARSSEVRPATCAPAGAALQ